MLTVAAVCQKNPHKHTYAHTYTVKDTAGPQLHTKTGVWKSMKEKEERGERSLNILALEKKEKNEKGRERESFLLNRHIHSTTE